MEKYLDFAGELRYVKPKSGGDTNYSQYAWNSPQEFGKKTGEIEYQRKNGYHPDHWIVMIA